MSEAAKPSCRAKHLKCNPWVVAVVVTVPAFMEILDTTIANVALRYIAGGLSAAEIDAEWVITSYLAANATILPISGWLSAHLGRRRYLLISIATFTLASLCCGLATSLGQIILFRVIQGLAGGGLQPSSQGVLLDSFPPEKQGTAQTVFGVSALIAPIVGPLLGGYFCDNYNWRWIFLVNLPVGIFALVACYWLVQDPDYLKEERERHRREPLNFDFIGLGLLVLVMSCWETFLSKGQQWDWLGDPFWRVQTLVILIVLGLIGLIFRELWTSNPIVNLRVMGNRNFTMACIVLFSSFAALYAATISLPAMLQVVFGYDAFHSGLVLAPGGISAIATMIIVGVLMAHRVDARWLIATGLIIIAISNYWTARLNSLVGPWDFIWPRMVLTAGLGFIFAPINVAAFKYVPQHLRGAAVGLANLLRNEGGSVGTSISQTVEERREQFHLTRLGDNLDLLNTHVQSFLSRTRGVFEQLTGDPAGAQQMAIKELANIRQEQAAAMAYFDVFVVAMVLSLFLIVLVFFMRPSVLEKSEPVGAE